MMNVITDYVAHLIEEHKELSKRIIDITNKINNTLINKEYDDETLVMYHQIKIMNEYKDCLEERLRLNKIIVSDNNYIKVVDSL